MSAEATPTPEQGRRAEQPVGLAAGSERLSRLVYLSRAIAAEQVSQRMLRVASRERSLTTGGGARAVAPPSVAN